MALLERSPRVATSEPSSRDVTRLLRRVAIAVPLVWLPIVLLWSGSPFGLTFDDAFYYAEIARNLVHGHGSTFDQLSTTNGYHPLWMGLSVLVAATGLTGEAAMRTALALQVVLYGGALWIMAGLVGRAVGGWPRLTASPGPVRRHASLIVAAAFGLVAVNPFVVKTFVSGLESGVTVALYAALLAMVDRADGRLLDHGGRRWRLLLGTLLALAFLGRTDAVLLVGCVAAWAVLTTPPTDDRRWDRLAEVLAIPSVVIGSYLLVNLVLFDGPLQVSGVVKRLPLTPGRLAAMAAAIGIAAVVGDRTRRLALHPLDHAGRFPRVVKLLARTGWFAAFCVLVSAYYVVMSAQQWLWYFTPVAVYLALLLVLLVADFAESGIVEGNLRPIAAILLVPLVLALGFQASQFTDPHVRSIQEANRDAGRWVSANLPDDAVLASWDAGVLGAFADQRVVNLDGVVNSYDYLDAMRGGTSGDFLRARDVQYVVNHGAIVDGEDPVLRDLVAEIFGEGTAGGLELVQTFPFSYSGTTTGTGPASEHMAVFVYRLP